MRLLKRQPGLPFLMALGVMLILSASFLAVQLWSGKAYRGAVEALEAPVMPPAMPTARKKVSRAALDRKIEKAKTVAAVEVVNAPDEQPPAASSVKPTAVASAPVSTDLAKPSSVALQPARLPGMIEAPAMPPAAGVRVKPAKEVVSKPEAAVKVAKEPIVVKEVKPVIAEPIVEVKEPKPVVVEPVAQKTPAPAVPPVKVVASPVVERVAVQTRKALTRPAKVAKMEDESVIPQEWNWFSVPLKMELHDGHIEMVPVEKSREIRLLTVSAKLPDSITPDVITDSAVETVAPAVEMPFTNALARMGKLRISRLAIVKKNPEIKKAVSARRSEAIENLRGAVSELCSRLNDLKRRDEHIEAGISPVAPFEPVESSDVIENATFIESDDAGGNQESLSQQIDSTEHQFVPYTGSGTELSSRINSLIGKGVGFRRK